MDPTAKKAQEAARVAIPTSVSQAIPVVESVPEVVQSAVPEVVVLDAPATEVQGVVDNVTPVVDNASDDSIRAAEETPSMLVINEDGTSNVSV